MKYIKKFSEIGINDIALVGGKNASLGQMIQDLSKQDIEIPLGFAITSEAYWHVLEENNLVNVIKDSLQKIDPNDIKTLENVGQKIRSLIVNAKLPQDLEFEIQDAYAWLSNLYNQKDLHVAIRSSATAEDLPGASFAGQQESYLNISAVNNVFEAIKKCMASLFTNRAIIYRINMGFDHMKVALSVGVQKMVRSDKASSGVLFTLDTDSGFKNVVVITSSYGLGESVVKGIVNPDEFHVHKPTLELGYKPIIKKYLGSKETEIVYASEHGESTKTVPVSESLRKKFSLSDDEILELAHKGIVIENYYSKLNNRWYPMDVEWAKDGVDNKLYIVQARPETIYGHKTHNEVLHTYVVEKNQKLNVILTGLSIGQKIAVGAAQILKDINQAQNFKSGDILITSMTDPDWVPLMKKAAAIVTNYGGRTSHAAIVSRELGIPAIIGTQNATELIKNGEQITVDCSRGSTGYVYESKLNFKIEDINLTNLPTPPVPIFINLGDPNRAYDLSFLPVVGVGLARMEFIISNDIKVHPMAVIKPEVIKDQKIIDQIQNLSSAYSSPKDFFVETLACGIATIAAAFYPRPVTLRLSDFKTNEYRNLIGGEYFEMVEENPMIGWRGASRYCDKDYAPAFAVECQAIKIARDRMGLKNIRVMVPFVRTIEEAKCTINSLESHGLIRGQDSLEIFMMCEIPSNVLLLEKFSKFFDGYSIGSNDLTQFTLAVDRDSQKLAALFDERDEAVEIFLKMAVSQANALNFYITICGQAPSDYPEIADFLIKAGINSISLNTDSVLPFILRYKNK